VTNLSDTVATVLRWLRDGVALLVTWTALATLMGLPLLVAGYILTAGYYLPTEEALATVAGGVLLTAMNVGLLAESWHR